MKGVLIEIIFDLLAIFGFLILLYSFFGIYL